MGSAPRAVGHSALLGLLLLACAFGGAPAGEVEEVTEREVLEFAERIDQFYRSIESRAITAHATFKDEELRGYFEDTERFSDYYASLANQVEQAHFRFSRADAVLVREFRFTSPGRAEVDVVLVGKHQRALRFWDIEIARTDAWTRVAGVWVLSPEKF
jgi:hypothetical protein